MADSPAHIAADFRQPERQPESRQASRNLGRKQGICNNQDESSASGGQGNEPSKNQEHLEEDDAAVEQHNLEHNKDKHKVVTLQKSRDKIQDEELSREL